MAVYKTAPTKAELIRAGERLKFLKSGYELLDKKRVVLIRESEKLKKEVISLRQKLNDTFEIYYRAMNSALITLGSDNVRRIARSVPKDESLSFVWTSKMGVAIPNIRLDEDFKLSYGYDGTNIALDRAVEVLGDLKKYIAQLACAEEAYNRMKLEVNKTAKRASALEKVQIPKLEKTISEIKSVLEEKEREEFFRMKKVKEKRHK